MYTDQFTYVKCITFIYLFYKAECTVERQRKRTKREGDGEERRKHIHAGNFC